MNLEMQQTALDIINFIKSKDNFLLTCHMNADGDAYAAVLSIANVLSKIGKNYHIIVDDEKIDLKYRYMWGIENIQSYKRNIAQNFDAAIVLDVPSKKRIGEPAKLLPDRNKCVKIDHHPVEDDFAIYNLVDTAVSSTCHLVYEMISESNFTMDTELATLLFSGIMYDTGRFSFSNTSQRDFQIAADLARYGVTPSVISNHLFFNSTFESMKTIGYGLANMESYFDGKVAIIFLPLEIMKKNNHSEIEELANYSVGIRNVEVGLFIRQTKKNFFKVSLRSKGRINVNAIAKAFGGGGHLHAAGTRFEGNYNDIKNQLLGEIEKHL